MFPLKRDKEGTTSLKTPMIKEKDGKLIPDKFRILNRFLSHEISYSIENLHAPFHIKKHFNWQDIPPFL